MQTWKFQSEIPDNNIAGERFHVLMGLCFAQSDYFTMNKAPWIYAKDTRLECALQPFRIKQIQTDRWFCRLTEEPTLKINVYKAAPEAKDALLQYMTHLFLWNKDDTYFSSLEDLCFFQNGQLFFGTVTHERICYAHVLSDSFGQTLKTLGEWEEDSRNDLASLKIP